MSLASTEIPAVLWPEVNLDLVVTNSLADPRMVKCLDDRVKDIRERIRLTCHKHRWTLAWIQSQDPEMLGVEARLVLDAYNLIEYLEYLKRGSE